jgi:hypothetical protein
VLHVKLHIHESSTAEHGSEHMKPLQGNLKQIVHFKEFDLTDETEVPTLKQAPLLSLSNKVDARLH